MGVGGGGLLAQAAGVPRTVAQFVGVGAVGVEGTFQGIAAFEVGRDEDTEVGAVGCEAGDGGLVVAMENAGGAVGGAVGGVGVAAEVDEVNEVNEGGLRFAMKNPLESVEKFRMRVSKNERDEEGGEHSFSEKGWLLAAGHRDRGSIHSDIWTGAAIDLAARDHIAVYPVGGWWKDRPAANRYNEEMRSSLVISIHAPDVDVDIYTLVEVEVAAEVAAEVEIGT